MTTRKLTANERTHGARAYSHNASRRAHQLSGPRRERVVCRPQGSVPTERNIGEYPTGERYAIRCESDVLCPCGCGYNLCARPLVPPRPIAPKPSPAPRVERKAHRFVVGQRVRCIIGADGLAEGAERVIERIEYDSQKLPYLVLENDGNQGGWCAERFEPLTSERGAQESDEALLLRCGWRPAGTSLARATTRFVHSSGAYVFLSFDFPGLWWANNGRDYVTTEKDGPRPLAVACAMALGIELECDDGLWLAFYQGNAFDTGAVSDAESCARAAVEAWSAMQREGGDGK